MQEDPPTDPARELVLRAVDGDQKAMRQLVGELTPVIRAGVCWVLARARASGRREARQEVEDITQTVLLSLFADRGRVLLQWDPARGLDLPGFAALLARRETVTVLRSRRRSPWTESPTLLEDLDRNAVERMGPESETISRDLVEALSNAVRERLTPRGAELFRLIFLEARPPEEVCEKMELTIDSYYAWKSRIGRRIQEIVAELARSAPPPPGDHAAADLPSLRAPPVPSGLPGPERR